MDPIQNQAAPAPTPAPVAPPVSATPTPASAPIAEAHGSTGPIIGSIIIVLILILGGLYYYGQQIMHVDSPVTPTQTTNEANTDQAVAKLKAQGNTDGLSEINADLQATDLSAIEGDTANVKATLSQ